MSQFQFTPTLHEAIDLAARIHISQSRKDPEWNTPYVAHLYGVATILLQHDFDEPVVIAGLLHDVLEDRPEFSSELSHFLPEVKEWIQWVSEKKRDSDGKKLPWHVRKDDYLEQIRQAPPEAKAIACADKIHNMQSTLLVARRGHDPWAQLQGNRDTQLAFLEKLYTALSAGWDHPILEIYKTLAEELNRSAKPSPYPQPHASEAR